MRLDKGSCHLFRQAMLGNRNVESTQIYTQLSIRALQAVHGSTPPVEQRENNNPEVAEEK